MRKWLNLYFSFSKREFNGLLVMITLIVVVSCIPPFYEWICADKKFVYGERKALQALELVMEQDKADQGKRFQDRYARKSALFNFDPNKVSSAEWQMLGLSAKQAGAIINYRSKGGVFRQPEDLKKMYTISPELYNRLVPWVRIGKMPDSLNKRYVKRLYPDKPLPVMVELNAADTVGLDRIKGIGPAFARLIVNYRNRLGGFYRKEQLLEVFHLDSIKYLEIRDQVFVDEKLILKININTLETGVLKGHPYLTYKQINAIIQFRKQHGNYSNIADLKKVAILSPATVEKLAPYISFSHD